MRTRFIIQIYLLIIILFFEQILNIDNNINHDVRINIISIVMNVLLIIESKYLLFFIFHSLLEKLIKQPIIYLIDMHILNNLIVYCIYKFNKK